MRTIRNLAVTCLMLLLSGSCGKMIDKGGSMTVRMSSSGTSYTQMNLDIHAVLVSYSSERTGSKLWIALRTDPGLYDLAQLQNGTSAVIADADDIMPGKITGIWLQMGNNNSLVTEGMVYPLKFFPGSEDGVRIDIEATVNPGIHTEVMLEFDVGRSVSIGPDGLLSLDPAVSAKSFTRHRIPATRPKSPRGPYQVNPAY